MKNRPIIGVMPLWDNEKESLWMLPGYFDGVIEAGGLPIMLPLTDNDGMINRITAICDGFLFTGGHDVSPELYGEKPRLANIECCPERDEMELKVLARAVSGDKPVLGICRGIQFINAALGGTLYQDLPTETSSALEHHQSPPYSIPAHEVIVEKDTPLFSLLGMERLSVNSYHHQAVRELAPQLKCMAAATDGIVEAAYMPDKKFIWAVQWHPEFSYLSDENSMKILSAFLDMCKV